MSICYSGGHIAGDHIHTDITTCNIEGPQQKYRLDDEDSAETTYCGSCINSFIPP